jgi:hypothetical protein
MPHSETIEIKLVVKLSYPTENFLPIFKHMATKNWGRHKIRFQCEEWDAKTQEIMDQACEQMNLWQGSTSKVKSITCCRNNNGVRTPSVQLCWIPYTSRQEKKQREKDHVTWSQLGFAVN